MGQKVDKWEPYLKEMGAEWKSYGFDGRYWEDKYELDTEYRKYDILLRKSEREVYFNGAEDDIVVNATLSDTANFKIFMKEVVKFADSLKFNPRNRPDWVLAKCRRGGSDYEVEEQSWEISFKKKGMTVKMHPCYLECDSFRRMGELFRIKRVEDKNRR